MSEPRDRRPDAFEIPDLELPPPRASQSGLRAVHVPAARQQPSPNAGENFGLSEIDLSTLGPELELEHKNPISDPKLAQYGRAQGLSAEDFALSGSSLGIESEALELERAWPNGQSPAREKLLLDATSIKQLAGFGDAPLSAVLTPWYAMRVFLRRSQLIQELRTIDDELSLAESERDELLAGLVERLRPTLEQDPSFLRLLAASGQPEPGQSSREADAAAKLVSLDQAALELKAELESSLRTQTQKDEELSRAEIDRERSQAHHKRCLIELRALAEKPEPQRIRALQERAELLLTEVSRAKEAHEALSRERPLAERARRDLERRLQSTERELEALRALGSSGNPRSGKISDADARRRAALSDVGRAVLAARGRVPVEPTTLSQIRVADARVSELWTRSELHLRALDACDADKVRQGQIGWVVLGTSAFALGLWTWL